MSLARSQPDKTRPVALILIAATAIVSGAVIGASTNAINGAVSPLYFRNVMRWQDVENIWRASIAQGIFEGLLCGIVFSIVFTLVVGLISRARCSFRFALRHMFAMILAIYCCWAVGGFLAIGLATFEP